MNPGRGSIGRVVRVRRYKYGCATRTYEKLASATLEQILRGGIEVLICIQSNQTIEHGGRTADGMDMCMRGTLGKGKTMRHVLSLPFYRRQCVGIFSFVLDEYVNVISILTCCIGSNKGYA